MAIEFYAPQNASLNTLYLIKAMQGTLANTINDIALILTKHQSEYFNLQRILKILKSTYILSAIQPAVRPRGVYDTFENSTRDFKSCTMISDF